MNLSRRDMLTRALPAAAIMGAGLGSLNALAQQAGNGGAEQAASPFIDLLMQSFQDGKYALPALPYEYNALEPAIDEQTMHLHHEIHHKGYVDGLNKAVEAVKGLGAGEIDPMKLHGLERDLSFNGGGHLLHTIFWASMAPSGGGGPQGALAESISRNFGSFEAFKTYFSAVAAGVKGSGWGLLTYEPLGDNLIVVGINEHDAHLIAGSKPILPLDVWEHAYYLKYQNKRKDYIQAWWDVVNWQAVGAAYEMVRAAYHGGGRNGRNQQQ